MADFNKAVAVVLDHEGGLTDDKNDPGGITNFGIILEVLRREGPLGDIDHDGDIDADDIRLLTIEDAKRIYNRQWWEQYSLGQINDQDQATKIFDLMVNTGPTQGCLLAQRALRAVGKGVKEDGKLGPKTLAMFNSVMPAYHLVAMRSEAAGFYRLISTIKPKLRDFIIGWLRRAYGC